MAVFDLSNPARMPIELACEHEVCTNCYAAEDSMVADANKIQCLVCKDVFKLTKAYQKLISEAKRHSKSTNDCMMCEQHPEERLIYVCSFD